MVLLRYDDKDDGDDDDDKMRAMRLHPVRTEFRVHWMGVMNLCLGNVLLGAPLEKLITV